MSSKNNEKQKRTRVSGRSPGGRKYSFVVLKSHANNITEDCISAVIVHMKAEGMKPDVDYSKTENENFEDSPPAVENIIRPGRKYYQLVRVRAASDSDVESVGREYPDTCNTVPSAPKRCKIVGHHVVTVHEALANIPIQMTATPASSGEARTELGPSTSTMDTPSDTAHDIVETESCTSSLVMAPSSHPAGIVLGFSTHQNGKPYEVMILDDEDMVKQSPNVSSSSDDLELSFREKNVDLEEKMDEYNLRINKINMKIESLLSAEEVELAQIELRKAEIQKSYKQRVNDYLIKKMTLDAKRKSVQRKLQKQTQA